MGQRPIAIRVKIAGGNGKPDEFALLSVSEVAHRLGISERTVFRRIRSGELERADSVDVVDNPSNSGQSMTDMMTVVRPKLRVVGSSLSPFMTDNDRHWTQLRGQAWQDEVEALRSQLREKDIQIAQLLRIQGQQNEMIQRLQDQLNEMSSLILAHHIEVEQARLKVDLDRSSAASWRSPLNRLLRKL